MAFDHEIGTSYESLATLSSIGVPPPLTAYSPGQRSALASGDERDMGWPVITWSWRSLPHAARDVLRAYCTGPSADIYIRTGLNDDDDAFVDLQCKMIWPEDVEPKQHTTHDRLGFTLRFKVLAEIEEPS